MLASDERTAILARENDRLTDAIRQMVALSAVAHQAIVDGHSETGASAVLILKDRGTAAIASYVTALAYEPAQRYALPLGGGQL